MKIGNKNVVGNYRFILGENEIAEFDILYDDEPINISVQFQNAPPTNKEIGAVRWVSAESIVHMYFQTISATPVIVTGKSPLGSFSDGTMLVFYGQIYRYGAFGIIELQLMTTK